MDAHSGKQPNTEAFKIMRVKRFTFKPMSAEEAIMQMNLLGHNFFAYRDLECGDVNVVYKHKDGNYVVIAPRKGS